MKKLLVLRHGKSSWDDPDIPDQERPLTERGRQAARRMSKYLKDKRLEPSLVMCTSALRARQTLELLTPAFPKGATINIEPRLYSASGDELITRLRRVSQAAPAVLMVGHNPAMQELVLTLASENAKLDSIRKKFPTAALAVLDAEIDEWKDLRPSGATLVDFVTPKGLRSK